MGPKTTENLKAAFAGESQAHMKYLEFADLAKKEGFPNVSRLFTAVSFAERVHATNHHRVLFGSPSTDKTLDTAIGGENYEVNEMYPAFQKDAEQEKEEQAKMSIRFALEAEKIHASLFARAKGQLKAGKDLEAGDIHICSVCGHTVIGDAPDACPVCGAARERFKKF